MARGLRLHAPIVANVAFIGVLVGAERSVVPLLAERTFGVGSQALTLAFIAGFGAAKAVANAASGWLGDRIGRRHVLIAGWALAPLVPLALATAPTWGWIVAANVVLGIQQGLTWTMTLAMMGDVSGHRRRGLAMGANEGVGYVAIAVATWASAELAAAVGLRGGPAIIGAIVAAAGLATAFLAHDAYAAGERVGNADAVGAPPRHRAVCTTAGFVTKTIDAGVWGLLPLLLAGRGVPLREIGAIAALYPLAWGVAQFATGALSDVLGRRLPIAGGMAGQGVGLVVLVNASTTLGAALGAAVLGVGTAFAYPTLLAAVQDGVGGSRRGRALGHYRFFRDAGFVVGALGLGALADLTDTAGALTVAAGAALVTAVATAWLLVDEVVVTDAVGPAPTTT